MTKQKRRFKFINALAIGAIVLSSFVSSGVAKAQTAQPPDQPAQMQTLSTDDLLKLVLLLLLRQLVSDPRTTISDPRDTPGVRATPGSSGSDPLAGIVKNATDAPKTDRNGICSDNGWIATLVGVSVVDVRSIGYVASEFADNCSWDSSGTQGTKTIRCEDNNLFCTLRFSSGEVKVYKGEAGNVQKDVTSYTLRYTQRFPTSSPFRNGCYVLTYDKAYGSTRNPSYETTAGNFDCPVQTVSQPGNPLSIVAPSDRSDATCTNPQQGMYVCSAPRTLTLTHPAGNSRIDVWPSYVPPQGCKGELVENGVTQRIACDKPAFLFANRWTLREDSRQQSFAALTPTAAVTVTATMANPTGTSTPQANTPTPTQSGPTPTATTVLATATVPAATPTVTPGPITTTSASVPDWCPKTVEEAFRLGGDPNKGHTWSKVQSQGFEKWVFDAGKGNDTPLKRPVDAGGSAHGNYDTFQGYGQLKDVVADRASLNCNDEGKS